jgi:predicted nucleic acid-binding protein
VRFWDSSALLPLASEEMFSDVVAGLLREDDGIAVWWGTWIECSAAISRLRRESILDEAGEEEARTALDRLAGDWVEQRPTDDTRLLAMLVSKVHPLKAADALQIAAALRWCEGETYGTAFVCLDDRLRRAATDEGFDVLPGTPEPA